MTRPKEYISLCKKPRNSVVLVILQYKTYFKSSVKTYKKFVKLILHSFILTNVLKNCDIWFNLSNFVYISSIWRIFEKVLKSMDIYLRSSTSGLMYRFVPTSTLSWCKSIVRNSVTKSTLCITVFAETFDMKLGISKRLNVLQQNEWMAPPSSYGLPTFCMTNYVITWYWLITYFYTYVHFLRDF